MLLAAAMVKDINPASPSSFPHTFVELNGALLFRADDGRHGEDWWRTDGTAAGTRLVKDVPGSTSTWSSAAVRAHAVVGNTLSFAAASTGAGIELWKTDGTDAGTVMVKDIVRGPAHSGPERFVVLGDTLFFSALNGVWKSDGTDAGTVQVGSFPSPKPLAAVGGRVLFQAPARGIPGTELWATDGTAEGTVFLKDINPGAVGSDPGTRPFDAPVDDHVQDRFLVSGGVMYFAATTAAHGRELWRTDGTPEGTRLVADAVPGPEGSHPLHIVEHGGEIYYSGMSPNYRVGVYRVAADGTTTPLLTLAPGVATGLGSSGGRLYFTASLPPQSTMALFALDDARASMAEVRRFESWMLGAATRGFVTLGDATYFGLGSGLTGHAGTFQLWRTDGTAGGTTFVEDFYNITPAEEPELVSFGGALYFSGGDRFGAEPWQSDGTREGTRMLFDVNAYPTRPSNPTAPVRVGDRWLFAAADGTAGSGTELWATDGTGAGTQKVTNPATGRGFVVATAYSDLLDNSRVPAFGTEWNGRLYFGAFAEGKGTELFSSDGTPEGTGLVADLYPGTDPGSPSGFTPFRGRLYFVTIGYVLNRPTLWSTDGTAEGTRPVKELGAADLTVAGDWLYFAAAGADGGVELWKTDGTGESTVRVKDVFPGNGSSNPASLTAVGDRLYFAADHPDYGRELWTSDGTDAGTVLVRDLYPGETAGRKNNGNPTNLVAVNGRIVFEATDPAPTEPRERLRVWSTDGTPAGTVPLVPLDFSPYQIARYNVIEAGGVGYFFRQRRDMAPEMWRTDGTPEGTSLVKAFDTAGHVPTATPVGVDGATVYVRAGEALAGWAPAPSGNSELWQSDGTPEGTVRLFSGGIAFTPDNAVAAGDRVLFTADDGVHGTELWAGAPPSRVVGRHVFYNRSRFDGYDAEAANSDDGAVAADKGALLPGQAAGFANVTSYTRGINGIMVDVRGLPGDGGLTADDFAFRRRGGGASSWADAPPPSAVFVRPGAGAGGSDRITRVWPDHAIRNAWLEVTLKANDRTGLASADVFTFGNLAGETGDAGTPFVVSTADVLSVRSRLRTPAPAQITNRYDFDRDGRVNVLDFATASRALRRSLSPTPVPTAPATASPSPPDRGASSRRVAYEVLTVQEAGA